MGRGRPVIDETGNRYGRLLVQRREHKDKGSNFICSCDCGASVVVTGGRLRTGNTKSCGCIRKEGVGHATTHGMTGTATYRAWKSLNSRCHNKNAAKYPSYGGRGITVCDRWSGGNDGSFQNFLADMGERPSDKHSIDRIDNDGPYSPDNCRWATAQQQSNNKRNSRLFTYRGASKTASDWSIEVGISPRNIWFRVMKYGWSVSQALGFEPAPRKPGQCRPRIKKVA